MNYVRERKTKSDREKSDLDIETFIGKKRGRKLVSELEAQ